MSRLRRLLPFLGLVMISSCRTGPGSGLVSISERKLGSGPTGNLISRSRPVAEPEKPPEIFVRQKHIVIEPKSRGPISGSLYEMEDPRNILLVEKGRGQIGSYLDVNVTSNRLESEKKDAPDAKPDPAAAKEDKTVAAAHKKAEADKLLEEALLKAFPDLDGGKNNPPLLKNLKFRVGSRLPNGDVLAILTRASNNGPESNSLNIVARVPYEALNAKRDLTTKDLYDVEWAESTDGDYVERKSLAWEDEYSLRLSGFSEAKSKAALALEDTRNQLKGVQNQLKTQLKNMTAQRTKITEERGRLSQVKKKHKDEKNVLNDKIEERESTIDDQKTSIENLEEEKKGLEKDLTDAQKAADTAAAKAEADQEKADAKAEAKEAKDDK